MASNTKQNHIAHKMYVDSEVRIAHIAHIEKCEEQKVCWMCGEPLQYETWRVTQYGIRKVMCDHCEKEEFGD